MITRLEASEVEAAVERGAEVLYWYDVPAEDRADLELIGGWEHAVHCATTGAFMRKHVERLRDKARQVLRAAGVIP